MRIQRLFTTSLFLIVIGFVSTSFAINPQVKTDPPTNTEDLPISQEATEESVLPEEPVLVTPLPDLPDSPAGLEVQPLPREGILKPSGPTVDERRRRAEAFRAAKSEAQEQFTLADIKLQAMAAATEKEKRALLREYYQSIAAYIVKKSPDLKDSAELWAYSQQNRLSRARTEPDYVRPDPPAIVLKAGNAESAVERNPKLKESNDLFPRLGN